MLRRPIWPHLHIIFALFWKTYDLLQRLLDVALEWFIRFLKNQCKNWVQNSQNGPHGISETKGCASPNIQAWAFQHAPTTFLFSCPNTSGDRHATQCQNNCQVSNRLLDNCHVGQSHSYKKTSSMLAWSTWNKWWCIKCIYYFSPYCCNYYIKYHQL